MHTVIQPLIFTLLLAAAFLSACGTNECHFGERCDGDIRQVCGSGPDHLFGRTIHDDPCEDPNPVCVEYRDGTSTRAQCVRGEDIRCDRDAFAQRCDGPNAIRCTGGYEVAEDCTRTGPDCTVIDDRAWCLRAPAQSCDDDFQHRCDGDHLIRCTHAQDGYVARRDCARDGLTCASSTNDYSTSHYCAEPQ